MILIFPTIACKWYVAVVVQKSYGDGHWIARITYGARESDSQTTSARTKYVSMHFTQSTNGMNRRSSLREQSSGSILDCSWWCKPQRSCCSPFPFSLPLQFPPVTAVGTACRQALGYQRCTCSSSTTTESLSSTALISGSPGSSFLMASAGETPWSKCSNWTALPTR